MFPKVKRVGLGLLRAFFLCTGIYGTLHLEDRVREIYKHEYFGRYKYLTNISLYITVSALILHFFIEIMENTPIPIFSNFVLKNLSEFTGWLKNISVNEGLKVVRSFLLNLSLGLESVVVLLYWPLHLFAPRLLHSKETVDKCLYPTLFFNCCQHLFPYLSVLLEHILTNFLFKSFFLLGYFMFTSIYFSIVTSSHKWDGYWAYPLLAKMSFLGRMTFFYFIGFSSFIIASFQLAYIIRYRERIKTEKDEEGATRLR